MTRPVGSSATPLATSTPACARPWPSGEMADRRPEVVLVRHGETEWSAAARHTGRTDVPLTEEGRRQAKALSACLSEWRFALVLTSPLERASETCRLAGFGDVAAVRDDLREWDYGDYEGRTTADIRT